MKINSGNKTDEKIIKEILYGNKQSFKLLVERYKNKIYSIGYKFLRNKDEAEDFTQEIFTKVYTNLENFNGKSCFKTWLLRIAYNHGINMNKSYKITSEFCNESFSEELNHENQYVNSEISQVLQKAITDLPDEYKICVDLFFFWGLKHKEISQITEIPVNTIKSNVHRAKKILYNSLKNTIAEDYHEM